MHKLQVTQVSAMAGRKKGVKCRERVQVHATLTFQPTPDPHDPLIHPHPHPHPHSHHNHHHHHHNHHHHSHGHGKKDAGGSGVEGEDCGHRERGPKGGKAAAAAAAAGAGGGVCATGGGAERVSFAEHAIKILDHMMKEKSVGELLKLGPREEMLGLTPLSMAAAIGHLEGTRKLLEAGAAVEDKSSDGSTALLNAAHWRHLPVLDLLLQHGANVSATNNEGNNALMVALRHGDVRAVNSLWPHRKSLDINYANNEGQTSLHLAADRKWESCVHFLIQNGADVNKQNNAGQTALHIAAAKGDQPTAERLLAAGASLLLEDHYGNSPFCLAVRGFHDFLAGYFQAKLQPEDKLYFCKRRVQRVQSQQTADTYSAWNAISFLTSDPTLRDALFECDVIMAAVQVVGRRIVSPEVAVQSCLVCCDLMYNPFPLPDHRFVRQFLQARGPEAVLDRLDSRGGQDSHLMHSASMDCKEVSHAQGHAQGPTQTRQQQVDFNTAFVLLPVMAMAETPQGRGWFAQSANQQRLAGHLRRLTSYRDLLQLVSLVQHEVCGGPREVKLDRVAVVERFIAFFNTLQNEDHEEKVRELLELEEREKSRKEKKREKKRLQRLKQKMKTRAGEATHDDPPAAAPAPTTISTTKDGRPHSSSMGSGGANGGDVLKAVTKCQPLDALDDIPLTVGPDGVQDVPDQPNLATDPVSAADDDWVMVGGKRCYPPKVRPPGPGAGTGPASSSFSSQHTARCYEDIDQLEHKVAHPPPASCLESPHTAIPFPEVGLDPGSQHQQPGLVGEYDRADASGIVTAAAKRPSPPTSDVGPGARCGKGGVMRWADIARSRSTSDDNPNAIFQRGAPTAASIGGEEPASSPTIPSAHKKEAYHEQFPCLGQPELSSDDPVRQPPASPDSVPGRTSLDVLGAAHQLLEDLYNTTGLTDAASRGPGQSLASQASCGGSGGGRVDANVLYEALTGWMWQAAVAQGLVQPDTDPPANFMPPDFLAQHSAKHKSNASKQNHFKHQPAPQQPQRPVNTDCHPRLTILSSAPNVTAAGPECSESQLLCAAVKPEACPPFTSPGRQGPASVKDWFNVTNADDARTLNSHAAFFGSPAVDVLPRLHDVGTGHRTTGGSSTQPATGYPFAADLGCVTEDVKTNLDAASVSLKSEGLVTWAGGGCYNEWLSSPMSAACPRVRGHPVADSTPVCGMTLGSSLDNPTTLEFLVNNRTQNRSNKKENSWKDAMHATSATSKQIPTECAEDRLKEQGKPCADVAVELFKHFVPIVNTPSVSREGSAQRKEPLSLLLDSGAKLKMKSAVVPVPRSSDSDSTQCSPSEQWSHEAASSLTADTSRSSVVTSYHSLHQASPSASPASSLTALHECLAPGFLRAAAGDVTTRALGLGEDGGHEMEDLGTYKTLAVRGAGLLPTPGSRPEDGGSGSGAQNNLSRQYPDLSTVPERDQPSAFPTSLPKASRVVGQGRPQRSNAHTSSTMGVQVSTSSSTALTSITTGIQVPTDPSLSLTTDLPQDTVSDCASWYLSLDPALNQPPSSFRERADSPEVWFPELLREEDEAGERTAPVEVFPSIHDMDERDLFQDVFSNSYFLEQIAIDQIRRRLRYLGGGEEVVTNKSVLFHDLDYYASLYGVRLRDVLGPLAESAAQTRPEQAAPRRTGDQSVPGWKALVKELGRKMTGTDDTADSGTGELDLPSDSEDPASSDWPWSCKVTPPRIVSGNDTEGEEGWWQDGGGSRRWRTWLRQILDMPWTMRRQYGKIVMPARSMEFNISRTLGEFERDQALQGRHPLILGFLTDGSEVGVLALDRTRHALDTRLMATVAADSEPDVHFVLRYKAVWQCAGRVFLAMELCDYTLDEYVGIVRLDHRQDPLSANRLAWQLLKGLKYLHCHFAVPHGNLMPGWIFVDCVGRLRLAGYGLRDVSSSTRSTNQDGSERCSIEGDGRYWRATEHMQNTNPEPSFQADIQVAGMLMHYILTGGRHPYGDTGVEVEANLKRNAIRQQRVSQEADHLVSIMTVTDPAARPCVDTCLKHPFFWSGEKRFRLVLIVGSDILTEMKTGVPLTGAGSSSMGNILNVVDINTVSDNWLGEVDPLLVKEMRAFRQYKNNLPELVLFVYNCCLHFDKMSTAAKEVLDDPCKYFQGRFSGLFMAVYKAMKASDRTDRTCYKPFF